MKALIKKSVALLLAFMMVLIALPAQLFAQDTASVPFELKTHYDVATKKMTLTIISNEEFSYANMDFQVRADEEVFSLDSIVAGADYTAYGAETPVVNPANGKVAVLTIDNVDDTVVPAGKEFFEFTYSVDEEKMIPEAEYEFSMWVMTAADIDGASLPWEDGITSVSYTAPAAEPEEADFDLKVLTFEGPYWDALIDSPQYGGALLYGESGMGFDNAAEAYKWTDSDNTKLFSMLSEGWGTWCYWSGGHAISNYVSGDAATYGDFNNQLTLYKNGVEGLVRVGGGHNGTDNFAVHYGYSDNSGYALTEESLPFLSFSDGQARVIDSMWVNNICYAINCYLDGNGLTAKIGENDWVKIVATGYNGNVKGNTSEIYLCNGPDHIITDWTKWDLSGLGAVTKVTFNVTGSSDNGYGFSQPAYFAYDDVAVRFPKEEVHTHELLKHESVAATCQTEGNDEYYSCECGKYFADETGETEIEEGSWVIEKTEHVDELNNATQAKGKDGYCDVCGAYVNNDPVLKEGVQDVSAQVVLGNAYLLRDLQAGKIFEDPDGDVLAIVGGGAGNAESKTNYFYNRSVDGGETWGTEQSFASSMFGATTISLTESTPGTYMYRFYAKDGLGGDSRNNEEGAQYWTLTLKVDTAENLDFDINFYISKDQNFNTNGGKYPIIKLWKSDGDGNKVGEEIAFSEGSNVVDNSYNMMYATVKGGWYVYEGYGWNSETEEYDIPLGGMQIKLPADGNVDGNKGGGSDIYLRVMSIYTSSKKTDNTYFGVEDYTVKVTCPIMQCDATMGTPYKNGNYTYYPTLFYAGGNSCLFNYYLYPTDSDTYMFSQSINGTLAVGNSVLTKSATINSALKLTVKVPAEAKFGLYFQYNNFNTSEQVPVSRTTEDGVTTLEYKVSKSNSNYTWRLSDPSGQYVTKAGWLKALTAPEEMTVSFENGSTEKYSHDFSRLGTTTINRDEGDLQVNLAPTGAKTLYGTTRVRAYRWWELINSDTANIMIEPDEFWDVISGPARISFAEDTVTELTGTQIDGGNSYHNWADIDPNGGTSIIAVHYNAIDVDTSNNTTHAGFYPATNPDRVGFIVVTSDPMGEAIAHVPYHNNGSDSNRSPEWDYVYDTFYYLRGDTNATLTFTAENVSKAEVAYATSSEDFRYSVSDYAEILGEDGEYIVPLTAFDSKNNNYGGTLIIRLTDENGNYSYQLVKVSGMEYHIENVDTGEAEYMPGDTLEVSFNGLYRSVNKMSGIFNPTTFNFRYTVDGTELAGTLGQYMRMDKAVIKFTVPMDIDFGDSDVAQLNLTNGYVFGSMYCAANPFSTIYEMTDVGVGTNFNAVTCSWCMQNMADIAIPVSQLPFVSKLNITDGEETIDGASIILKKDNQIISPDENGNYNLNYGTYTYEATADGYIRRTGQLTVASTDKNKAENGIVLYDIILSKPNADTWDGSTKTVATPNEDGVYEISTGAELAWFASQVNAGSGASYKAKLTADIDLGSENWTAIGNSSSKAYKGNFDGNGHIIKNLYCNGADYQGLFGYLDAAVIKDLAVYGSVNGTKSPAGGIAAYAKGATSISGCVNHADVSLTGVAGTANGFAGGIVGQTAAATVKIENCYNTGVIYCSAKYAGGILGGNSTAATRGEVTNCYNIGRVSTGSTTLTNVGSIGLAKTVTNSYYLKGTTNGTNTNGTAVTSKELKALASELGDSYKQATCGYPLLTWQQDDTSHEMMMTEAVEESCTEAGNYAYWYCANCDRYFGDAAGQNEIEKDSWITPATGHIWNEGEETKAPTYEEEGIMTFTCTKCEATRTEPISNADIIEEENQKAANAVDEEIALIGEVTLDSKEAIQAAREAYDALSDEVKAKVTSYQNLVLAETKLELLEVEKALEAVRAEIERAQKENEELAEALAKVNKQVASEVEKKIDAIGEVTKDSKNAIEDAEQAYNELTDVQKEMVENKDVLDAARARYEELAAIVPGWNKNEADQWIFVNEDGSLAKGWLKDNNKWYYMDEAGIMQTGWVKVGETWYYLYAGGSMATGWIKLGNTWYYLKSSGAMATGWLKVDGTWYFFNPGGSMATGWIKLGNTWYYLKSSGAMAQSETLWIGGAYYSFNSSGAWIG